MTGPIRKLYESLVPHETRYWLYKLRHPVEFRRKRSIIHPSPKGDFSLRPFDEHRCIFVHVTKSAGTSVATSLFGYLPYHHTATEYRVIFGRRDFNEYFKFAFVRNPWDRAYSAYRYLKNGGWNDDDRAWAERYLSHYDDFGEFVRGWMRSENLDRHIHFWPQSRFLCDRQNRILVDEIAYFETLNEDFASLADRLNIDAQIEHRNASPTSDYRDAYDDETRQIIADVYRNDIELFGYDFDGIRERTTVTH